MPAETDQNPDEDVAATPRSRRRLLLIAAAAVPVVAFVLWWFQPQGLLFDDVVDEEFPGDVASEPTDDPGEDPDEADAEDPADADAAVEDEVEAADPDPDDAGPDRDDTVDDDAADDEAVDDDPEAAEAPSGPVELATGSFVSRNRYTVTGTATTFELDDGEGVLRLEDFESTNGPDLFVYLTVAGTEDDDAALDEEFVDLGVLTGNIGNQNYTIPAEVDLDRYDSVVIWCRRFTTSFGVADLDR